MDPIVDGAHEAGKQLGCGIVTFLVFLWFSYDAVSADDAIL